jgi:hypothetical protein
MSCPGNDTLVLCFACSGKRIQVFEEHGIECRRRFAGAGEALHPYPVGDDQMIERAMERAEEGAAVAAEFCVAKFGRGRIDLRVGPAIISGEHPVMSEHSGLLQSS